MGILYLVPTPVGNLEDITYRALRILKEADLILAEDTRTTGILLKHFEIKNAMLSYHKFNEHQTVSSVVSRLNAGETVAVVSDAGTPGISDPGFLVDGDQIRDQHRPQQFFLRGTDFFCIGNDRQGCRHTLVSAAGDNAHR